MEFYICQGSFNAEALPSVKRNFKQGDRISEEVYNSLPDNIKANFLKLSQKPMALSDVEVRKLLLELRERVETLEAVLPEKQVKAKGN